MSDKTIEVAHVVRRFIGPYERLFGHVMLPSHRKAIRDISACMTESMGGGRYHCENCEDTFWRYHGCRNRTCPKCHGRQIAHWLRDRSAELLPCDYFHVVATVPQELRRLFLREQKMMYGILMKAASAAVCELARDKRYVGAVPGILAVLHTWTGRMNYHPHVHMLVTGGGLSHDGTSWCKADSRFLMPVKKLSPMIAQRFAKALKQARPDLFAEIAPSIWKKEWCSFCKPFGNGPDAVLKYLARYVFRIAIASSRILAMDESQVTFRYKDSRTQSWKTERVRGIIFIRRFLLHVLPKGFHKVRYYGLWCAANQNRQNKARMLLQVAGIQNAERKNQKFEKLAQEALKQSGIESNAFAIKCPKCKSTHVVLLQRIRRGGIAMQV